MEVKYVIYRAMTKKYELLWTAEPQWDDWVRNIAVGKNGIDVRDREISRGHSLVEAIRLCTMVNEQHNIEGT